MIKDHCFTQDWLDKFKKQKDHSRIDKLILEKMIYALHLLERIKTNGLDFVFKGGTSLVLLLEEGNRFSMDIDIISNNNRESLENILNRVIDTSLFTEWNLDTRRSYQPGIPKAHYKFKFETEMHGSGTVFLDILIENPLYPELIEKPIITKWIETDEVTLVTMPSIDALTGDKLTAFAPNTIGIPYFKGEDNQPFSMEICKQLFDLSKLFERIKSMELVSKSFQAIAKQEIAYKNKMNDDIEITLETVLHDTIATCLIIGKRGSGTSDEKIKYAELQRGIRAFGSGYLMSGNFRIDEAVAASSRVALLASKLLVNDLSPIEKYDKHDIKDWNIEDPNWNILNRLKRHPDKSSFYYWYQTVKLLTKDKK